MIGVRLIGLLVLGALSLTGCDGGVDVTPNTSTVLGAPTPNTSLSIGGTPATAIVVGTNYSFTPTVSGNDGLALQFSVANAPAWLTFDAGTGRLSGTPAEADVGNYSNIAISVTDGASSSSLPPFSIAVAQAAAGTAALSWTIPTHNTNGSVLANLAGFRIQYGPDATNLGTTILVASATTDSYVVPNLTAAVWYFTVTAYTTSGAESSASNVGSKSIN